jgi:hypothetical protein
MTNPQKTARELVVKLLTDNPNGLTMAQLRNLICNSEITPNKLRDALAYMRKQHEIKLEQSAISAGRFVIDLDDLPEIECVQQSVVNGLHTTVPPRIKVPSAPIKSGIAWSVFQLVGEAANP